MAGSFNNRLGTSPEEGIKTPVVVATNTPITLSGEQTIRAVEVVAGDRVLVRTQADGTENGIYIADNSAWTRAPDLNAAEDVVNGIMVLDYSFGDIYQAVFTGSWDPGVTSIAFEFIITVDDIDIDSLIPLAGTSFGRPITGILEFVGPNAAASLTMSHQGDYFGTLDAFVFHANGNETGFYFNARSSGGQQNQFGMNPDGTFTIPTTGASSSKWVMGTDDAYGTDAMTIVSKNSLGALTNANMSLLLGPLTNFAFLHAGTLTLPRTPTGADDPLSAATVAYVDAVIPPGGGEANDGVNLGAGSGFFTTKSGDNLQFKSLVGGTAITLTSDATTVTVNYDAGGGGVDYIPLSGTLGGSEVTGVVEFTTGSIQLNVDQAMVFGTNKASLNWTTGVNSIVLTAPTSGAATGISLQVWDGTATKGMTINATGVRAPTDAMDAATDTSLLTLGWWKTELVNYVALTGNQTMLGDKIWSGGATFNGGLGFATGAIGDNLGLTGVFHCDGEPTTNFLTDDAAATAATLTRKDYVDFVDGLLAAGKADKTISINANSGLSGTGTLAGNVNLSVDSSVIRTTGNQNMSGTKAFTSHLDYTSHSGNPFDSDEVSTNQNVLDVHASDLALKDVIGLTNYGLDEVNQFEVVDYVWKEGAKWAGDKSTGNIAQHVECIVPEAVHTSPDGKKYLDPLVMIGVLVKAVQELSARLDQNLPS